MQRILAVTVLLLGIGANAQEYGALVGVHQTSVDATTSGVSSDSKLGLRAGLAVSLDLVDTLMFRTGVQYVQRHYTLSVSNLDFDFKMDYLDFPATALYRFNEMFGVFGGAIVALNVGDEVSAGGSSSTLRGTAVDVESPILLLTVGANMIFNDMFGFEAYYERGLGDIEANSENFSVFGANFIYWFY